MPKAQSVICKGSKRMGIVSIHASSIYSMLLFNSSLPRLFSYLESMLLVLDHCRMGAISQICSVKYESEKKGSNSKRIVTYIPHAFELWFRCTLTQELYKPDSCPLCMHVLNSIFVQFSLIYFM